MRKFAEAVVHNQHFDGKPFAEHVTFPSAFFISART
jgi:hypothetical protein